MISYLFDFATKGGRCASAEALALSTQAAQRRIFSQKPRVSAKFALSATNFIAVHSRRTAFASLYHGACYLGRSTPASPQTAKRGSAGQRRAPVRKEFNLVQLFVEEELRGAGPPHAHGCFPWDKRKRFTIHSVPRKHFPVAVDADRSEIVFSEKK